MAVWLSKNICSEGSKDDDEFVGIVSEVYEGKSLVSVLILLLQKLLEEEENDLAKKYPNLSIPVWDDDVSLCKLSGKTTAVVNG